ncbi:MAG: hypothetical protein FJ098_16695 [Deltaproteobacteria bacterium]|nr:hypothetical protein [Deltaproteobacteria bacterium]
MMSLRTPVLLFLGTAIAASAGCIPSRCYQDRDCPDGRLCNVSTGACVVPDCTADEDCGAGLICKAHVCVDGCATDADCGQAKLCVAGHCVLETSSGSGCSCVPAPAFCAPDLHPASPTFGTDVCLGDASPTAKLLFFGNVG